MACADLDGYWMARAAITEPKDADEVTSAEIFIAGPATDDAAMEGVVVTGLAAFLALRNLLNAEYDRWQESLTLGMEDIPQ
jgi:hypothetical protein